MVRRATEILTARIDNAAAKEADARLAEAYRQQLESPEGYLNTAGKASIEGRQAAIDQLEATRREIAGELTSPRQREMFSRVSDARRRGAHSAIDKHFIEETRTHEIAGSKARVDMLGQDIVDAKFNGTEADYRQKADALFGDNGELGTWLRLQGVHPDQAELMRRKAQDEVYGTIVNRMLRDGEDKPGAAIEAAEFLKTAPVTDGLRARLQEDVQEAGVQEQAFQLKRFLGGKMPGDLMGQLDTLDQLVESKDITLDVRDAAAQRLRGEYSVRRTQRAVDGANALSEATTWQQLNPNKPLPKRMQRALSTSGKAAEFELWKRQGNQFVTTAEGLSHMLTVSDSELLRYNDPKEVENAFRYKLGNRHLEYTILRWHKLKGKSLSQKDAVTLELGKQELQFLRRQDSVAKLLEDTDGKKLSQRLDGFHEAVVAEINRLARGNKDAVNMALRNEAMQNVWADGGLIKGKWVPRSMWLPGTADEGSPTGRKPDTGEESIAVFPTSSGGTITAQQFTGQTFNTIGRFGDVEVDLRGSAGRKADLRPDYDTVVRLTARNKAIDQLAAQLGREPSEDEITSFLASSRLTPPSSIEVADFMEDLIEGQERRREDANRLAKFESRMQAQAALEALAGEVDAEFGTQLDSAYQERERWQGLTALQQAREGFVPQPNHHDITQSAIDTVLDRHMAHLHLHGVNRAEALMWIRERSEAARPMMERVMRPKPNLTPSVEELMEIQKLRARYGVTRREDDE